MEIQYISNLRKIGYYIENDNEGGGYWWTLLNRSGCSGGNSDTLEEAFRDLAYEIVGCDRTTKLTYVRFEDKHIYIGEDDYDCGLYMYDAETDQVANFMIFSNIAPEYAAELADDIEVLACEIRQPWAENVTKMRYTFDSNNFEVHKVDGGYFARWDLGNPDQMCGKTYPTLPEAAFWIAAMAIPQRDDKQKYMGEHKQ